jgi:DNA polymerase-3 subunit delta'
MSNNTPTPEFTLPANVIIGHEWLLGQLQRALYYERIRHAYLFVGPEAIGKTTVARWLAMAVNCVHSDTLARPCGECRACRLIGANRHPDVSIIESEYIGATLKIEQMRELQRALSLHPHEARYKVVIIRRFHEAQPLAQDALLKTLEEPSEYALLLLTATSGASILPTITSRSQVYNMRPLPLETTQQALMQYWYMSEKEAHLLGHLSGGRLGWAVQGSQNRDELALRDTMINLLETVLSKGRSGRFQIAEQLASDERSGKINLLTVLELWQTYWRDMLLVVTGSQAPLTNVDHQTQIKQMASKINQPTVLKAIESTRRTADYLQKNANTRLCLEVLMLDYPL